MLREVCRELLPSSRVLVLKLHAGGTDRVPLRNSGSTVVREGVCHQLHLGRKLLALLRMGAISTGGHHQRPDPIRVV
jgi:hypothetical protein